MIIGIGTDILDARRIKTLLERFGQRAKDRLFTGNEQAYADAAQDTQRRLLRYANRFAAKEATIKALGRDAGCITRWTDIEIVKHASGAPLLALASPVEEQLLALHNTANIIAHVSLSDEYPYCTAYVVLQAAPRA